MGWSFVLGLGFLLGRAAGPVLDQIFWLLPATTVAAALVTSPGPAVTLLVITGYLGLRFGLVLPAAALGRPLTLHKSWALTQPASGALLGRALLTPLGFALTGVLGLILFEVAIRFGLTGARLAVTAALAVVSWASLMLGLSLLTTLYGHLVEHRALLSPRCCGISAALAHLRALAPASDIDARVRPALPARKGGPRRDR